MKNKYTISIASVTLIAAGIVAYFLFQKTASQKKQETVAVSDAGYETAYDVLYPLKNPRFRRG